MRAILPFILLATPALAQQDCKPLGWDLYLDPGPQTYAFVERIEVKRDHNIVAFAFGELQGEVGKVWLFASIVDQCLVGVVSLGSYDRTVGRNPDGSRLYHLDHYGPDMHATLGLYDTLPAYETIRDLAVATLD